MEFESIPIKCGCMKKEGEKWKGYRSRYFVLSSSYILRYFENEDGYKNRQISKGLIDLTLATKILVYDNLTNPYSLGIMTKSRVWKLQCAAEKERDLWVAALRNLLEKSTFSGYIRDYNRMKTQKNDNSE